MRKGSSSTREHFDGKHRIEHWYRDNSVYFITARCRGQTKAFATDEAKAIFWAKLRQYADAAGFVLIVATLMDNHYHILGYLAEGRNLGPLMQRFHGSVAKLVNDTLPERLLPFWTDKGRQNYFDGCLRDETQFRRTYRYVQGQSVRHVLATDWRTHPHTRVGVELERALGRARQKRAFLEAVPYARYDGRR